MDQVLYFESIDSTNAYLKKNTHLPNGTVVIANEQTAGRGRAGRGFLSLRGKGIYLSMLTHPVGVSPEVIPTVTAWVAVAVCDAIEACIGIRPMIKWVNDLIFENRKICGILNEIVFAEDGTPSLITGIGLNLTASDSDFGEALCGIAGSLAPLSQKAIDKDLLIRELVRHLRLLFERFPDARDDYLAKYRRDCITLGKEVLILANGETETARAIDVDTDFSLIVESDGVQKSVNFGDVSVRGICGYLA